MIDDAMSTYLNDNLVGVEALGLPLDVALDVVVAHLDGELNLVFNVDDAAVGVVLGVDLAVEDLVGPGENRNGNGGAITFLQTTEIGFCTR